MKQLIFLSLMGIFIWSCSQPGKKDIYNPQAIELNNKAVKLLQNGNYDSALVLFDQAIALDSTYYVAHTNKVGIFMVKKEPRKALAEIETAIKLKPDAAGGWELAGMFHDGMGDSIAAQSCYKKSIELIDQQISKSENAKQTFAFRENRSVLLILLGQEMEGKEELHRLKIENPDNPVIDELLKRSKQDFINEAFLNPQKQTGF